MNKLLLDSPKGPLLLCVLEAGNLERLKKGEPIEFSLNDPGLYPRGLPAKLSIGILYSETPVADAKKFAAMVKPGGQLIDTRTPHTEQTRPHCPECKSTLEQLGVLQASVVWMVFCPVCGCALGPLQEGAKLPQNPEA